jgi:tetratricopeptide (TPR) repeat protein
MERTTKLGGRFLVAATALAVAGSLLSGPLSAQEVLKGTTDPDIWRLFRRGRTYEAFKLAEEKLAEAEKASGPKSPEVATILDTWARVCVRVGRYGKAEPLFRRALAIREERFGTAHPLVAFTLDSLAGLFYFEAEYDKAEKTFKRALALWEAAGLVEYHNQIMADYHSLKMIYVSTDRPEEAKRIAERSEAVRAQITQAVKDRRAGKAKE